MLFFSISWKVRSAEHEDGSDDKISRNGLLPLFSPFINSRRPTVNSASRIPVGNVSLIRLVTVSHDVVTFRNDKKSSWLSGIGRI